MERYLDYLSNRVLPYTSLRPVLEGLWNASAVPGGAAMTERLAAVLEAMDPPAELQSLRDELRALARRAERLDACCRDPRLVCHFIDTGS